MPCILMLGRKSAVLLTWLFWPSWVAYSRLNSFEDLMDLSLSILSLSHCIQRVYSSLLKFDIVKGDGDGDLGLCMLRFKEQPLISLFRLNMALTGSSTILMSRSNVGFKELKLIIAEECVKFPKSLISATMQDGGKREKVFLKL